MNKQHGFSTVELLIVTGILAIFAIVIIPSLAAMTNHSPVVSSGGVIESSVQGTVIATVWNGSNRTKIFLNDSSSFDIYGGEVNLILGNTYSFSFYNKEWHIDHLVK